MNLIEYIYLHASNGSRKLMGTFHGELAAIEKNLT